VIKNKLLIIASLLAAPLQNLAPQDVYSVSSGELLFQFSDIQINGLDVQDQLRFTMFFHWGQYWHLDFNNSMGMYTGLAVRNVGFIYDQDVPLQKTIRRAYTLGVPLAFKLGAFDKHFYLYAGGEYEMLFHYKAKRWYSNEREGAKIRDSEWFSDKTNLFVPSAFAGIQFPGGVNVKFKYYLGDFLNTDYVGRDLGVDNVSFAEYTRQEMFYLSVSWQFRTDKIRKYLPVEEKMALR
jgi:hypothetical protein